MLGVLLIDRTIMLGASGGTRNASRIGRQRKRVDCSLRGNEQTRQAIDEYLRETGRKAGNLLAGRGNFGRGLTSCQCALPVGEWFSNIGLDSVKVPHACAAADQDGDQTGILLNQQVAEDAKRLRSGAMPVLHHRAGEPQVAGASVSTTA